MPLLRLRDKTNKKIKLNRVSPENNMWPVFNETRLQLDKKEQRRQSQKKRERFFENI